MKLRKLQYKDVDYMLEWMHDSKVNYGFRFDAEAMKREDVIDFIEKSWKEYENGSSYHFAIVLEDDEYLGTISLKNVDREAGTAEYAISLRSRAHGKGIASAATKEILDFAFDEIQLNRVYLNVLSDNTSAIRLYERNGFQYEGEFRQHIMIRENRKSLKWYAMLQEEYRKMTRR